jgi:hypothetical protein
MASIMLVSVFGAFSSAFDLVALIPVTLNTMKLTKQYILGWLVASVFAASAVAQATTTVTTPAAAAPAAPTSPVSFPPMEGPLSVNATPESFVFPDFGKIYVSGVVSAIAQAENYPFPGESRELADISNAQIFVQKVDGVLQFALQAGVYSFPTVGVAYSRAATATNVFGPLPQAYLKIAPTSNFSIEAGKLPTLIGAEYTFSYENMNIERGLLWEQETSVSRGVQVNYTAGPVAFSASWNDGFYSDRFNWLSGSAAWTIDSADTLALIVSGNAGSTDYSFVQNDDAQLDNLIYSFSKGSWIAQAYVQYAYAPAKAALGYTAKGATTGYGILASYAVPNTGFNLAGRAEYISSSGSPTDGAPNVLYGPGSSAWSLNF